MLFSHVTETNMTVLPPKYLHNLSNPKTYGPTIYPRYPLRCLGNVFINYDIPHQIRKRHAYIDPDRVGTTNQQGALSTAV